MGDRNTRDDKPVRHEQYLEMDIRYRVRVEDANVREALEKLQEDGYAKPDRQPLRRRGVVVMPGDDWQAGKIAQVEEYEVDEYERDLTKYEREKVKPLRTVTHYTIEWTDVDGGGGRSGVGIGPLPDGLEPPQVGQIIQIKSAGLGSQVRGINIDGHTWWEKTDAELEADHERWKATREREQAQEYERALPELNAQYDALPPPLKARIDRFRAADPKFRQEAEAYEMSSLVDAAIMAKWAVHPEFPKLLRAHGARMPKPEFAMTSTYSLEVEQGTDEWEETPVNCVRAFDLLNSKLCGYRYQDMTAIGKAMAAETGTNELNDGHSGNTWAHAVMFAIALLEGTPL